MPVQKFETLSENLQRTLRPELKRRIAKSLKQLDLKSPESKTAEAIMKEIWPMIEEAVSDESRKAESYGRDAGELLL